MPIRVLLAGNSPLKNQGIHARIAATDELILVETTEELDQLPDLCTFHQPDLLLIILDGWAKQFESLAHRLPGMNIVGLFSQDERPCHALIRSGVINGCLPETAPPEIVIQAIRAVAGGCTWFSQAFFRQILRPISQIQHNLTDQELAMLRLVAQDKTNQAIGQEMDMSERTVCDHLSAIYEKLGVASRLTAALKAERLGLFDE